MTALNRRQFLAVSAAATAAIGLSNTSRSAPRVPTSARIVIAGAGAAGLTVASRLARHLSGAAILLIDERTQHIFQPGYTLVGSGVWDKSQVITPTSNYVAPEVEWIQARVAEFDPEGNKVVTSTGQTVPYDYLVVCTGLKLDYAAIDGMDSGLVGMDGIASIYASPESASASWQAMQKFVETGGVGVFGRPNTEMKCAGAPLKYAFLTDDRLRTAGRRGKAKLIYNTHDGTTFSVPPVEIKVRELFQTRGISTREGQTLTAIDPGRKTATFTKRDGSGTEELDYDFIHVIPPMRVPDAVYNSPLPWQDGVFSADGWIEVDKKHLQHRRYSNVFGVGDVNGVPKGKTAASVKWQAPVAVENLVAAIQGKPMEAVYNGYTSCPLVTGVGTAMLVEFDYQNNFVPSFPFIDPLKEQWLSWAIEEKGLKPTYYAMLRGAT